MLHVRSMVHHTSIIHPTHLQRAVLDDQPRQWRQVLQLLQRRFISWQVCLGGGTPVSGGRRQLAGAKGRVGKMNQQAKKTTAAGTMRMDGAPAHQHAALPPPRSPLKTEKKTSLLIPP